jgi:hypothetical protein
MQTVKKLLIINPMLEKMIKSPQEKCQYVLTISEIQYKLHQEETGVSENNISRTQMTYL